MRSLFSRSYTAAAPWFFALLAAALVAACGGGGRDPVLGNGGATLAPSVTATTPLNAAAGVCPSSAVTASFSGAPGFRLDPATVNAASFTLTGPGATPVVASAISVDAATGRIATFKPVAALTPGVVYTATLKSGAAGVKDNATPANAMVADFSFAFTAGASTPACLQAAIGSGDAVGSGNASILGMAAPFGTIGGSAGMTNQGILTIINGDIGTTAVSTAVTGFHSTGPGCTYTEVLGMNMGLVTGRIYTAAPPPTVACPTEGTAETFAIANQARLDAVTAYNALAALPDGGVPAPANLATRTLAPGVYKAPGGSFMIQGGDLTLDAQGDPNAVFVFQMASTLTVGGPGAAAPQSVTLINGAQPKNVFWQVGTAATINAGGGGTMVGTIIASSGAAFSTAGNVAVVTLNGRALSLGASVTLVNTVINVPAP
ncbi:MAG: ice-binding family protein [Pseudomonadota bacterium]